MLWVRRISHENQDAWAAKPFRLSWTTAFVFSLQLYEYFNRKTRWSASARVRASVTEAVGAVLHGLSLLQGWGSCFLPTPPCKGHGLHVSLSLTHLLHIGTGERVTKSRWHVYPVTQKTQYRRHWATFVPVIWKNSHARTPCSLTTCCTQRWIVSLGKDAQTGHGLILLPQAPAALWVHLSSSPHLDFPAIK